MKYLRNLIYCIAVVELSLPADVIRIASRILISIRNRPILLTSIFCSHPRNLAPHQAVRVGITVISTGERILGLPPQLFNNSLLHQAIFPSVGDKYLENIESNSAPFEFIYTDLRSIATILKETGPGGWAEGQSNNTRQAARILRAFLFHRLTDYYGSVPYSEATVKAKREFSSLNMISKGLFTQTC